MIFYKYQWFGKQAEKKKEHFGVTLVINLATLLPYLTTKGVGPLPSPKHPQTKSKIYWYQNEGSSICTGIEDF